MTRGLITRQYQCLAIAVINQAELDADPARCGKNNSKADQISAIDFLDNSEELEFFAEIAECIPDMERAGYLKKGEYLWSIKTT